MSVSDFFSKGYCVLDNFLSPKDSARMLGIFSKEVQWTQIDQERDHYKEKGPFWSESKFLPSFDEKYYQRTKRAKILEQSNNWRNVFSKVFLSEIQKVFRCNVVNDTTYILKYSEGDFSRVHTDDLRGEVNRVDIGILYYLCESWKWDWGGLLLVAENGRSDNMEAILPVHNRLILLNHQRRCPHSVTPVTKFARNARYCVASFIGCEEVVSEKILCAET